MSASVPHNEWLAEATTPPAARLPGLGDERLAWLAARGSTRAFAAVYERYHQPLYRYCRSIVRDDADAQDALQSTFMRALSALKRDRRSAPLRPWLFRIAHNESISVLRRRRGGSDPSEAAPVPLAPSAEDQARERARLAMLMDDLAALPDRARNALVMRELSGLSHEDIAIALEISEGAAKQAIFEARRGLHECAEGRAMLCADVCRAISDGDRRVIRGRRIRAHLRDCGSCAAFAASITTRQSDLRALVPALPAAASAAVLTRALHAAAGHAAAGHGAGATAAGAGAAGAAGAAGKTAGVAFTSKGFATASMLATAAVSLGGVAAVVRLAPEAGRLGKSHSGHSARISTAHHQAGSGGYAGSEGYAGLGAYAGLGGYEGSRVGTAPGASGSSVDSRPGGTPTGATSRQIRLTAWPGYGRGLGGPRGTFGAQGKSPQSEPARGQTGQGRSGQDQTEQGQSGQGEVPRRGEGHAGVGDQQAGWATGHGADAGAGGGQGRLAGYMGGRDQPGALDRISHGDHAGAGGSGAGAADNGAGRASNSTATLGNGSPTTSNSTATLGNGSATTGSSSAAMGSSNERANGAALAIGPASAAGQHSRRK